MRCDIADAVRCNHVRRWRPDLDQSDSVDEEPSSQGHVTRRARETRARSPRAKQTAQGRTRRTEGSVQENGCTAPARPQFASVETDAAASPYRGAKAVLSLKVPAIDCRVRRT